jgi:hypothetical protein
MNSFQLICSMWMMTSLTGAAAFAPATTGTRPVVLSSTSDDLGETSNSPITARKSQVLMSQALPFLARPKLLTGELAGDFGFDPLGLARSKEELWNYREMEIKHARLAMLAAAGWPLSELLDRPIAAYYGIPSLLDDADRVPLFGTFDQVSPEFWGFCLGLTAAIDSYHNQRSRASPPGYVPGDLGWDPLNLYYNRGKEEQFQWQLAEIQNGRLAMLAVVGFGTQEVVSQQGVVDETPFFFLPLSETAEMALKQLAL